MPGGQVVFGPQRPERRLEFRDGRSLGHDLGGAQLIERPKAERDVHALARPLDPSGGFVRSARNPHIIDDPVAADRPLDQSAEAELALLRRAALAGRGGLPLQDIFAIQPDLHGLVAEADEDVMPLAVADIDAGIEISTSTGKVDAQGAPLEVRIDLPMGARGFLAACDQDVVAGLSVQLGPELDRERPLLERRPTLRDHAAGQSLAVFRRQRRHAAGRLARNGRGLGDRLLRPGPILRLGAGRRIVELRHEPLEPIQIIKQTPFGVFHGVIQDADDAGVAAGPHLT